MITNLMAANYFSPANTSSKTSPLKLMRCFAAFVGVKSIQVAAITMIIDSDTKCVDVKTHIKNVASRLNPGSSLDSGSSSTAFRIENRIDAHCRPWATQQQITRAMRPSGESRLD